MKRRFMNPWQRTFQSNSFLAYIMRSKSVARRFAQGKLFLYNMLLEMYGIDLANRSLNSLAEWLMFRRRFVCFYRKFCYCIDFALDGSPFNSQEIFNFCLYIFPIICMFRKIFFVFWYYGMFALKTVYLAYNVILARLLSILMK